MWLISKEEEEEEEGKKSLMMLSSAEIIKRWWYINSVSVRRTGSMIMMEVNQNIWRETCLAWGWNWVSAVDHGDLLPL